MSDMLIAAIGDDPSALESLRKERRQQAYIKAFYNKFGEKESFEARCLSGGAQGEQTSNPSGSMDGYYPINVRPLDIHQSILEDPCGPDYAEEAKTADAKKIIALHPIAYGADPLGAGERTPGFGEVITCYFAEADPNNKGKMRDLRYHYPKQSVTYDYKCANATLQGLVGQFTNGPALMGGFAEGQGDRPFNEAGLGQPPEDALYLGKRKRRKDVTHIVVHTTAGWSKKGAIRTLMKKHLSYHYIIDYDGSVENLLDPAQFVAFHAPPTNNYSVGISFVNVAYERKGVKEKPKGVNTAPWQEYEWLHPRTGRKDKKRKWQPFTTQQVTAYVVLMRKLVSQFGIKRENIKMHAEVSTSGKMDPGPAFPWNSTLDQIF